MEGVSKACIAITAWEPQPWEQSADEAILAAPILSALCVAGTCHCFTLAHILPPCFSFSVSPAPFARTSMKKESVGVDGVMWLQICLWACKAVLSVQLFTLYVWWDLNVTVSTLRFYDCPKAALGGHLNISACHMCLKSFSSYCCVLPPQTPDSWTDKSQNRRGSSSHKRSASWGSAENLREVNVWPVCSTSLAELRYLICLYQVGKLSSTKKILLLTRGSLFISDFSNIN